MKISLTLLLSLVAASAPVTMDEGILRFDPDVALTGEGKSREHVYYTSEQDPKISAGVWESGPASFGPRARTYSEFIHILEGSVALVDGSGHEQTFAAGDSALIPRGTELTWMQPEKLRKFWVIFDLENEGEAATGATPVTVVRLEPNGPGGGGLTANADGRTKSHSYYSAKNKRVSVGVWETKPFTTPEPRTTRYAELMVFLEGEVTLSDGAGREQRFAAGDVALVPRGIRTRWDGGNVKKYWVIFDPEAE